ncbi:MAG: chloride channel protein [Acidimicrobiia bacterium]
MAQQIGATIGSSLARYTRFGEDQIRSLVVAGAAAGIGASFNAPIAGMLFGMEVLLGNFSIRHLNAVVVSSVAAAVTTRSLVGEERILSAPPHQLSDPRELILYVLLGLLAVLFALWFLRLIKNVEGYREPRRIPVWVRPVVAGLVIAAIGAAEPRLLATGQDFVASLLQLDAGSSEAAISSTVPVLESLPLWLFLGLIAFVKPLAATLTRSSGGSGGSFMPSLYIGAVMGAGMALLVGPVWGFSEIDPGAFAVVGMAATFAAVARAPLTSIIIVFEITGDYGLVLPLMLASSLATFLADRYHPETSYTLPLKREGIHLPRTEDIDLLDTVMVGEVMSPPMTALEPSMTTEQADRILAEQRHHGLPVVSSQGLVGIVTVSDIASAGDPSPELTVADVMTPNPVTVVSSMSVSAALARMATLGVGRMPVIAEDDPSRCVGMFRRESVVRAYHHALGATTDRSLYRERFQARKQPGATFFEIPVPTRSAAAGSVVRDLAWPEEAILVSIRRAGSVLIPHGSTTIREGDTVTAFGTSESRIEAAYLFEPATPPSPEPGPDAEWTYAPEPEPDEDTGGD